MVGLGVPGLIDWQKLQKKTCHPWKVTCCSPKNHPFAKENHLNQTTIVFKMWTFQGVKFKVYNWFFENLKIHGNFELLQDSNWMQKPWSFLFSRMSLAPTLKYLKSMWRRIFSTYIQAPTGSPPGVLVVSVWGNPHCRWEILGNSKGEVAARCLVKDTSQGLAAWGSMACENWTTATEWWVFLNVFSGFWKKGNYEKLPSLKLT